MRFIPNSITDGIEYVNPALISHTRVAPEDMAGDGWSVYGFINDDIVRIATGVSFERALEVAANPELAGA